MKFDFSFDDDSAVDITSLIDVLFLLLVFFILAATFSAPNIDVALSKAKTASSVIEQAERITFGIDKDGNLFYGKNKIEKEDVQAILLQKPQDTPIVFNVDKDAPFNAFIGLLDKVKELGFSRFLLNAEKDVQEKKNVYPSRKA